jgi:hypothetical protein
MRAVQDQLIRRVRQACVRQAKDKVIEESSTTVGANDRLATPVGCRPIPQLRVDGWAGARAMLVVVSALLVIAELHDRNEPVPVEHGHVVVEVRRGMPDCDSRPGAEAREQRSESEFRFLELANLAGLQAGGTSRCSL